MITHLDLNMHAATMPDLLAITTILAEAGNQPFEGMVAVGEVIRNRTKRRYNSDGTIMGTLMLPWQFSCWNNDMTNRRWIIKTINNLTLNHLLKEEVVGLAIKAWSDSYITSLTAGAVLYHNVHVAPSWSLAANVVKLIQIGDHLFYNEIKPAAEIKP
jgi:spore germination cell wall hydrolase CwlJ-like protein